MIDLLITGRVVAGTSDYHTCSAFCPRYLISFVIKLQANNINGHTVYIYNFLYIYLSRFCKNIWSATNFAKIYICRRGPRR
jgi:hypothetical protein